jgi:hypothetical protein
MYKIIGADGKEYGPITADQLRQWIAEGRVNAQTRVLVEGATEWRPLADIPDFVTALPSAPPPPPLQGYPGTPALPSGNTSQVDGPAIALIVTAVLGFLLQAGSLILHLAGLSSRMDAQNPFAGMFSGTVGIIGAAVGMLVSFVILFGGIKMRKLENHGLAMTASILAMIPCISPCCLIGLPVGIWALVILSKPEVKLSFH